MSCAKSGLSVPLSRSGTSTLLNSTSFVESSPSLWFKLLAEEVIFSFEEEIDPDVQWDEEELALSGLCNCCESSIVSSGDNTGGSISNGASLSRNVWPTCWDVGSKVDSIEDSICETSGSSVFSNWKVNVDAGIKLKYLQKDFVIMK